MIDPRVKGFMIRLFPSLLAAAGVSFCLLALMAFLIADNSPTQLAPPAKPIKVIEVRPPEETIYIMADVVETLPKSFFTKENIVPEDSELHVTPDYGYHASIPFEKVERVEMVEPLFTAIKPNIDRDAILLAISNPQYPFKAEKEGIEGHVVVAMNVNEEGRVDDAWIVEASPLGYFEAQALRAAKKFKYRPRIENGKEVLAPNLVYRWDFNLPEESDG